MRSACLFLFLVFFALSVSSETEARVYCPLPEDGIWVNPKAKAKELSRLEIETKCIDDQVLARMRAFTKCAPRDCKWGWTKAELREGGGLSVLLVGFLSSKYIQVRRFGDYLDTLVIDAAHDEAIPRKKSTYNLIRK